MSGTAVIWTIAVILLAPVILACAGCAVLVLCALVHGLIIEPWVHLIRGFRG